MTCDPVGPQDIAVRLGVQRDTVIQWKVRGLLPDPQWVVSGNPCWNWETIEAWAKRTHRLRDITV